MPDKTPSSVSGFYDGIYHYYEAANSFLTLGLDAGWRTKAAGYALASKPAAILDVCCGTGDLTLELLRLSKGGSAVTGADFNDSMLAKARARSGELRFLRAEASDLPFSDGAFNAVTISFASRNLSPDGKNLAKFFREFHRVLAPGGVFVHLETSRPRNRGIRCLFRVYVDFMTGLINFLFPETRAAYAFLAGSIAAFPPPDEISKNIIEAGFREAEVRPLLFGAVAIHIAVKTPPL